MQSTENRIKTDLIWSALELAELELRRKGSFNTGPYSTAGMVVRAKEARAREIRAAAEERRVRPPRG